jgi:hypothetical protein
MIPLRVVGIVPVVEIVPVRVVEMVPVLVVDMTPPFGKAVIEKTKSNSAEQTMRFRVFMAFSPRAEHLKILSAKDYFERHPRADCSTNN